MDWFLRPFRPARETGKFPNVLIPLQQVTRQRQQQSSQQRYQRVTSGGDDDEDGDEDVEAGERKRRGADGGDEDEEDGGGDEADVDPLLEAQEDEVMVLKAEIEREIEEQGGDSAYARKSRVINRAVQDIGMGRYQWHLFMLCGMGWLADNLWMQGLALVLPRLSAEFGVSSNDIRYTTMITYIGLSIGSTFWGVASDVIGRRPAFNMTLFLCGAFGFAAAFGPNWFGTAALFLCMGLGVGGNLPVDGALFLEFLPATANSLLTLLSVWWPVGQLVASILAWLLIPPYSCAPGLLSCSIVKPDSGQECCSTGDNIGWRLFIGALGVLTFIMFVCRFFLFHLYESPKFLLSRGRQTEAVAVIHGLAHYNRTQTWLTEDILNAVGGHPESESTALSAAEIAKQQTAAFDWKVIRPLFHGWKLAVTTLLIWFIWATIGMAFPLFNAFLPQYLEQGGKDEGPVSTNTVYRNYLITSAAGVPGSILACWTVDLKYVGRKGTMAISTLLSAVFLYMFTLSTKPAYQTFCASAEAFFQNIMYGVLYAYTPEVFPAPSRGTGNGIASLLNRITGICAPIVAAKSGIKDPVAPILAAGALYIASFVATVLLPLETRGQQSL